MSTTIKAPLRKIVISYPCCDQLECGHFFHRGGRKRAVRSRRCLECLKKIADEMGVKINFE